MLLLVIRIKCELILWPIKTILWSCLSFSLNVSPTTLLLFVVGGYYALDCFLFQDYDWFIPAYEHIHNICLNKYFIESGIRNPRGHAWRVLSISHTGLREKSLGIGPSKQSFFIQNALLWSEFKCKSKSIDFYRYLQIVKNN